MDVAAHQERRACAADRVEDRPAAEMAAVHLVHVAHACHGSVSVSALPGTRTAGASIALRVWIVLSRPRGIVA
jgi:hypothetical protein